MKKTWRRSPGKVLCVPLLVAFVLFLGFGSAADAASPMNGTLSAKGVYAGEADGHTVAIRLAGKEKCFQIPDDRQLSLAGIREGNPVRITYKIVKYPDGISQLVLLTIKR